MEIIYLQQTKTLEMIEEMKTIIRKLTFECGKFKINL